MNSKNDVELPLLSKKQSSTGSPKGNEISDAINIDINKRRSSHFDDSLEDSSASRKYVSRPPFFKWITFTDMIPHVKRMHDTSKEFGIDDIPNIEYKFCIEPKVILLGRYWAEELKKKEPKFYRAVCKAFIKEIIQALALVTAENLSKIFYSIYMGKIISIITSNELAGVKLIDDLISSAIILSILVVVSIFAKSWFYFMVAPNLAKTRFAISSFLYKKLNSTSLASLQEIKVGKVLNLIANDLNDIQNIFFAPALLATPIMIAVSIYVMWGYFGASCLIGLGSLIGVIGCQVLLSAATRELRHRNKSTADERVKYTHELIEGIRLIKMYTWEKLFQRKILENREVEHKTFIKMGAIEAIGSNLSSLCVYLIILLICIVYTMLGGILSPEKVYASMMILTCLSASLLASQQALMALVNVKMVIARAQEVLSVKDILSIEESTNAFRRKTSQSNKKSIVFKDFTGYWNQNTHAPCVSNINLTCHSGTLTAVIGKIGAGKTSLLLSFLREMPVTYGTLEYSGRIAYVEQDPIIFSGTVRENILFGRKFNESLYEKVIESCRLQKDFDSFPYSDLTLIGERGVNLSGGQKARVSLARAFYSQSDIYLLDDPFSALDSKVSREIFDMMVNGGLLKSKTTILVTHHLHFAKESQHVVLMDEGKIAAQGTFEYLESLNISLLNIFKSDNPKKMSVDSNQSDTNDEEEEEKKVVWQVAKVGEKAQAEQSTQTSWITYREYLKSGGSLKTLILMICLFVSSHVLMIYYSRFIGYWAEQQTYFAYNEEATNTKDFFDNGYYIVVSLILLGAISIISYLKTVKMNEFFFTCHTELHGKMLMSLLRSKVSFFDINPVGRILNRFSNDVGILDKGNVKLCFDAIDNGMSYIAVLITVCFITPTILIPALFVMYGLYRTRQYFNKPLFCLKKVELVSNSPIISAVPATIQGLISIRVYNQGGRFIRDFMEMIFQRMKTFVCLEKTIRLFGFILEASIQSLTLSGVWTFIFLVMNYNVEAGILGLCLMSLLKIGDQGSMIIRQTLYVDINMQSAQRMIDYSQIKSEAPTSTLQDTQIEKNFEGQWPTHGEVTFKNVFMKYREGLGFALKGLSINVSGGLKVGCIGRTGAGKSSIIQVLFRMVEIETGPNFSESCIKIDGVDVQSIGLNLLRSKLSIIPQTPVIFAETIKKNLDPFEKISDRELWNVLEEVGLKDYVYSLPNQLNTDITGNTSVFSTGQKQLICLARAIINKNKIIILDEATANVDVETDNFIQRAIMEKFKDCTVLTIAHRLITIANYDKVVVIDDGRVAEYDSPYSLLVQNIGDTQITRKEGMFSEMVRSTGKSMARKIFAMAKNHYFTQKEKGME